MLQREFVTCQESDHVSSCSELYAQVHVFVLRDSALEVSPESSWGQNNVNTGRYFHVQINVWSWFRATAHLALMRMTHLQLYRVCRLVALVFSSTFTLKMRAHLVSLPL